MTVATSFKLDLIAKKLVRNVDRCKCHVQARTVTTVLGGALSRVVWQKDYRLRNKMPAELSTDGTTHNAG